ncbi:MAG: hypothetical protein V9H26_10430 [Verrucomicrobiota bacterium]
MYIGVEMEAMPMPTPPKNAERDEGIQMSFGRAVPMSARRET